MPIVSVEYHIISNGKRKIKKKKHTKPKKTPAMRKKRTKEIMSCDCETVSAMSECALHYVQFEFGRGFACAKPDCCLTLPAIFYV